MTHRRTGFTLTEMLVAIAITSIVIIAVNQIFSKVSFAIGLGVANSDVLAVSRVVGDQLEHDARVAQVLLQ